MIRLRWNRRALGCFLPLMAIACVMFGRAAVDADFLASLHHHGRHLFFADASFAYRGVNLACVGIVLFLLYKLVAMAWRWADEYALGLDGDVLVAHRSLRWPPIPLRDVTVIELDRSRRTPALVLRLAGGDTRRLGGIDADSAAAFVAAVRGRLGQSPACAGERSG